MTGFKDLIRRTAPEPVAVGTEFPAVIADGLVYSHAALVAGAFQLRLWVPDVQAGRERLLNLTPGSSPFGVGVLLGLGVLAAATMVYPIPGSARTEGRSAARATKAAAHAEPTLLAADERGFEPLSSVPDALGSLRLGLVAGHVDQGTTTAIHDATGARIRGGLAVPGVPGLVHANPVYGRAVADSFGLPLPDTRTTALDPEGRELGPGKIGVIGVHGPQVADGYWQDPAATAAVFTGGWLRTAHRGYLDGDGYLWLEA